MYRTGAHTKHRLKYHLVWLPKYRKRILRGKIAKEVEVLFYRCAEVNDWWIERMQIKDDHVHLLVQLNTQDSVAETVQRFKGGSSMVMRKEHPELEEYLWGDSFWADGYFAETVGRLEEDAIRKYIEEQ